MRKAAPSLQDIQSFSLVDSLPWLIEIIIHALEHAKDGLNIEEILSASERHAEQRAHLANYPREQVFLEYNVLREVIFQVLETHEPVTPPARDMILNILYASFGAAQVEFDRIQSLKDLQNEKRIEVSEARYADLVNHLGHAIAWISEASSGRFIFVGKSTESILGYPAADWLAEPEFMKRHLHPDDVLIVEQAFHRALTTGDEQSIDHRMFAKDARQIWFRTNFQLEKDEKGQAVCFRGLCFDISALKRTESQNQHLLSTSKLDLAHLRQEQEMREKFVMTLTHDLRNPLGAAKLATQLLMLEKNADKVKLKAERVIHNINRIEKMVSDLLDAGRLRAGHALPLVLGQVNLSNLVRTIVSEFSEQRCDRFRVFAHEEIQGIWSADGLTRAIENLIGNAVKYGDEAKPITIQVLRLEDKVVLSVHNEGNPIPPEDQVDIFEPFRRSRSADLGLNLGWGIGLTLVRGVAEAHGGKVAVTSCAEKGTTFFLEIPLDSSNAHLGNVANS